MMEWWLDKGIDGFRMDVINMISKVPGLPDAPVTGPDRYQWGGRYFINGPRLMEFLTEMKQRVLSRYDILTVGETPSVSTQDAVMIAGEETGALTMVFQFEHMGLDSVSGEDSRRSIRPWKLPDLKAVMTRWQKDLEGRAWNSIYLTNHDQPRAVSRFGNDRRFRVESAKLLATFTHMLQGTPYIYQGEEIGMTNVAFETIEDYRDVETLNIYREVVGEKGGDPKETLKVIHAKSRDNARTPMQWDDADQAGFTEGIPWIKVNPNYREINAAQALADPDSIFYYYQKLIQLRKEHAVIVYGNYDLLLDEHEQIYAFTRTLEADRLLVILNFSEESAVFHLPESIEFAAAELLIANYEVDHPQKLRQITLRPYEARVYHLSV
jgi:oligo-1,6-glucosidase